ncbi:hypothetical protein SNE40_020017 [Patella caerulea]|uniref:Uncharacterized protein n=1 Tax=Patella caerulea TaxID=87958 RepID=A0AAN8J4J6_PATCE
MNYYKVYTLMLLLCSFHFGNGYTGKLKMRNKGDRHNIFIFHIPIRYINSTLGPETYEWIVNRFGQATADNAGIYRSPNDSHVCSNNGWCKYSCSEREKNDWTSKDICGRFFCCVDFSNLSI